MLYYLGKGMEFKKEDCKEYKTIVTPFAGVWIEMFHTASKAGASFVTPFVGVWIEIKHSAGFGQLNMSLPLWECGLK